MNFSTFRSADSNSEVVNPETILVVDDQACLRDIASIILNRCGYRVLTAADGEEARRLARQHAVIDLVLTEFEMPGISGNELAPWFQAHHPRVQIVFMSGNRVRLRSIEPCWAVEKPFIHIDMLIKTIRDALDYGRVAPMTTTATA